MNAENITKTGVSALGALLAYFHDGFTSGLIFLLIAFEIGDYLTGIAAGYKNGGLSSKTAFWGFIKKLCYFVLIGVAFGVDYVISEAAGNVGLSFEVPAIFGVLAVCYLLSTEAISILENLGELGIEAPFLSKFIAKFRVKISEKGGDDE